ncbi:MAG: 3-phosphoshikimate 1-carboxyvinyltransferase [Pseudomonadota bacterium]
MAMSGLKAMPGRALAGRVQVPGDKSISHRALMLGAIAQGKTSVHGLLEGEDVLRTAGALRAMGARIERDYRDGKSLWHIEGGRLQSPQAPVFFGNSGTGVRLMLGLAAGQGIAMRADGDVSLRSRPMGRVIDPLSKMGIAISSEGGKLPLTLEPQANVFPLDYRLPVPSAQVKSAVLLAGLGCDGETVIRESARSRDHTERMLKAMGADLSEGSEANAETGEAEHVIRLRGPSRLKGIDIEVPGDPSSAAFPVAAALITPGSEVTVEGVLMNPLRTGLFKTLKEMGADIAFANERDIGGEEVADIIARHSRLKGVAVPASRAPSMIDEYPILAIVAAFADGDTYMPGIEELRVKECDRIDATQGLLKAAGVETDAGPDWLRVIGQREVTGGAEVSTFNDHRIAMSGLVLGLASKSPVSIDTGAMIATSFPAFLPLMQGLGAVISER